LQDIETEVSATFISKDKRTYVITVRLPKPQYGDEIEGIVDGHAKVIGLSSDSTFSSSKAKKYLGVFRKDGIFTMVAQMEKDGIFQSLDAQNKAAQTDEDDDENEDDKE